MVFRLLTASLAVDLNKKQRRRFERRQAARVSHLPPQVPAHHQATDITAAQYNQGEQGGGDSVAQATEVIEKRTDITKSAREARRKGIREANFLKGL
jgi:large subunit ribosomal protein L54